MKRDYAALSASCQRQQNKYKDLMWEHLPQFDPQLSSIALSTAVESSFRSDFPGGAHGERRCSFDGSPFTMTREFGAPYGTPHAASPNDEGRSISIGKYAIGRIVGRGTRSVVRAGRNLETGAQVAIKAIDKFRVTELAALRRLDLEARVRGLLLLDDDDEDDGDDESQRRRRAARRCTLAVHDTFASLNHVRILLTEIITLDITSTLRSRSRTRGVVAL